MTAAILLCSLGEAVAKPQVASAAVAEKYCSDLGDSDASTNPDGMSLSDVEFGTPAQPNSEADDCYGAITGNINDAADVNVPGLWGAGSDPWSMIAKSDDNNGIGTYDTIQFDLDIGSTPTAADPYWTYLLKWSDLVIGSGLDFNFGGDLLFAIKQSDGWGAYLFETVIFNAGEQGTGQFVVRVGSGNAENSGAGSYSHVAVFFRGGSGIICQPDDPGCGQTVPEPGTLAALGAGLLGMVAFRRRERRRIA